MKKTNESGRSMMEMLGVLAIVGVLSIGGITGFRVAMDSHEANQKINTAMRLAMLASNKRIASPTATLTTEELEGFTMQNVTGQNKFTLQITGLSDTVRTKIQNAGMTTATVEVVNPDGLKFTFNNDLSVNETINDPVPLCDCSPSDYTAADSWADYEAGNTYIIQLPCASLNTSYTSSEHPSWSFQCLEVVPGPQLEWVMMDGPTGF